MLLLQCDIGPPHSSSPRCLKPNQGAPSHRQPVGAGLGSAVEHTSAFIQAGSIQPFTELRASTIIHRCSFLTRSSASSSSVWPLFLRCPLRASLLSPSFLISFTAPHPLSWFVVLTNAALKSLRDCSDAHHIHTD